MTLSDLASIGSLVSGVAVLVSLVYLAQQIRQAAKHTRAQIQQGRTQRITEQQLAFADAGLSAAWIAASGLDATPDAVRERQFRLQCIVLYVGWDDTLAQYRDGLISEDQFARFRRQMIVMLQASPAARAFFAHHEMGGSGDRLAAFVAALLAEAESGLTATARPPELAT
jgi:hypothetical protein